MTDHEGGDEKRCNHFPGQTECNWCRPSPVSPETRRDALTGRASLIESGARPSGLKPLEAASPVSPEREEVIVRDGRAYKGTPSPDTESKPSFMEALADWYENEHMKDFDLSTPSPDTESERHCRFCGKPDYEHSPLTGHDFEASSTESKHSGEDADLFKCPACGEWSFKDDILTDALAQCRAQETETVKDCAERIKGYQDELFKAHAELAQCRADVKTACELWRKLCSEKDAELASSRAEVERLNGLSLCNEVMRDKELKARCEVNKLRAALVKIAADDDTTDGYYENAHRIARAALAGTKDHADYGSKPVGWGNHLGTKEGDKSE